MFNNIWADIQNYFKDWLQKTGGVGAYTTFLIDLSEAHSEQGYNFSGDQIIIVKSESRAYIKLNDKRNENIDTTRINQINTPFKMFYITNDVGTGSLEILVGTEGVFNSIPARINAVITDPEDTYGHIHQIGNAEIAARLGSVVTYDRRGNVVFIEDFEKTAVNWILQKGIGDETGEINADKSYYGSKSYKMVTSGTGNGYYRLQKCFTLKDKQNIGLEATFRLTDEDTYAYLSLVYYTGKVLKRTAIRFHPDTRSFEYYDKDMNWQVLKANVSPTPSNEMWLPIKLVINIDNAGVGYVRSQCGHTEVDMSGCSVYGSLNVSEPILYVIVGFYAEEAVAHTAYVDNIILTQNEP